MTATLVMCASSHFQFSFVLGILVPLEKALQEIIKTILYFDTQLWVLGPLFVFRVALSFLVSFVLEILFTFFLPHKIPSLP